MLDKVDDFENDANSAYSVASEVFYLVLSLGSKNFLSFGLLAFLPHIFCIHWGYTALVLQWSGKE